MGYPVQTVSRHADWDAPAFGMVGRGSRLKSLFGAPQNYAVQRRKWLILKPYKLERQAQGAARSWEFAMKSGALSAQTFVRRDQG